MFQTLLASGPAKRLSKRGWLISGTLHSALLAGIVVLTGRAIMPALSKPQEQHVVFANMEPPPPPVVKVEPVPEKVHVAPKRAAPKPAATPQYRPPAPKPKVAQTFVPAPIAIATTIPAISAPAAPVGEIVVAVAAAPPIGGGGTEKASASAGSETGTGSGQLNSGEAFTDDQVERIVQLTSAPATPRFPETMRSTGVQGTVAIRFVVGTNGRVESKSFEVMSSPHDAFSEAVKRALLLTKYRPAEVRGKAVRQLVEQSFTFKLDQ
ncbi:MAG: TonB family protein [Gemmatimonadota bacterium]